MKPSPSDPLKTRPSLIDKIRNLEDEEAWSEFVKIYRPLIVRISLSWKLPAEDAEDVAQKALAWVVEKIRDYEYRPKTCPFRAWLLQKVRHLILDSFRERRKNSPGCTLESDAGSEFTPAPVPDPKSSEWEKRWDEEHQRALLDAASQIVRRQIAPKYYQAFDMYTLQGQPAELVAEKLGVTLDYVHLATHRFKAKLKVEITRLMKEYG